MTSFLTIWIHGTIEISAIIIAGAAGLILGDGLLNPKTDDRSLSLQVAAKRSIRILLSTVPLFIIAGFLESFVTRLTGAPTIIKVAIIAASLGFILFHYVIYPYRYHKKYQITDEDYAVKTSGIDKDNQETMSYRGTAEMLEFSLAQFRLYIGSIFYRGIMPVMIFMTSFYWIWAKIGEQIGYDAYETIGYHLLFDFSRGGWALGVAYILVLLHLIIIFSLIYRDQSITWRTYLLGIKHWGLSILLMLVPLFSLFYFLPYWAIAVTFLVIPPHLPFIYFFYVTQHDWSITDAIKIAVNYGYNQFGQYIVAFLIVSFIYFMMWLGSSVMNSTIYDTVFDVHEIFPGYISSAVFFNCLLSILVGAIALFLYTIYYYNQHQSTLCKQEGIDLEERILNFGTAT